MAHEATRSGAPMVLLHLVRWLRESTDLSFEILLLAGGPLAEQFAAVAPTTTVEALGRGPVSYLEAGIARAGFPTASDRLKVQRAQRRVHALRGFDAVYLNSATSALALRILPEIPPLVISHIHELGTAFSHWFPDRDRRQMLEVTDRFVACSDGVADCLIDGFGVPRERVSRHYEFIEPPSARPGRTDELRRVLGIPDGAAVIGGSGSVIWRKGPDLFVQLVAAVRRRRPDLDLHGVWVGGGGDEPVPVDQDALGLGLEGLVHFVGELEHPADLIAGLDVFCLTSREDPYPLVMLEAAALGVPVVAFANGGVVEFAGEAADRDARRAAVVPYLDVGALADEVAALLDDPDRRGALAERGRDRVLTEHAVEVAAPALYEEILSLLAADDGHVDLTTAPGTTAPARHGSLGSAPR